MPSAVAHVAGASFDLQLLGGGLGRGGLVSFAPRNIVGEYECVFRS